MPQATKDLPKSQVVSGCEEPRQPPNERCTYSVERRIGTGHFIDAGLVRHRTDASDRQWQRGSGRTEFASLLEDRRLQVDPLAVAPHSS
jgi:hypothetical protein